MTIRGEFLDLDAYLESGRSVVVALSGGVDSAVAALLLKEAGFKVTGITMKNFCYGEAEVPERSCCSVEAIEDAKRVCLELGIGHAVLDVEEDFRRNVIEDFFKEYAGGRTPNPCVRCNVHVRFRWLSDFADKIGADFMATGHYARIFRAGDAKMYLGRGTDKGKDQSYFLSGVSPGFLARMIFPLGNLEKKHVREMAAKASLPVAEKGDSQEACFVTERGLKDFLSKRLAFEPGPIVDLAGRVIGEHEGVYAYTVGQRKGLGSLGVKPQYVVRLDVGKNEVVVGDEERLYRKELDCSLVWIDPLLRRGGRFGGSVSAQIRSRHEAAPIESMEFEDGLCRIRFKEPQRAICPGQTVAFYLDDLVVGSGVIAGATERGT